MQGPLTEPKMDQAQLRLEVVAGPTHSKGAGKKELFEQQKPSKWDPEVAEGPPVEHVHNTHSSGLPMIFGVKSKEICRELSRNVRGSFGS